MTNVPLRWMWELWRPHKWLLVPMVFLTALNAGAVTAVPLAVKNIFDVLSEKGSLRHAIMWLAAAGVARFVVYCTLQNMRAYINARLEWSVRSRIFSHLVGLGPTFFGKYRSGDLITRLTNDIGDEKLAWFLCSGVLRGLEAAFVILGVGLAMLRLNPSLALWCLVPLPVLFFLFLYVTKELDARYKRQQAAISAVNDQLESSFSGVRLVKAYGMEDGRRAAFNEAVEKRRAAEFDATRTQVVMENVYGYSWQLTTATVMLLGGRAVILGDLTLGDFVAFNGLALSLTFPMFDLGTFLTRGRQALVCIVRLREIEDFEPDVADGPGAQAEAGAAAYRTEDASYQYLGRDALRNVSVDVPRASLTAVTGRVGEGKTTLLRLCMRLMDPQGGRVLRHGASVRDLSLSTARQGLGYVPQDPIIFSSSIEENIRFGREDITDADLAWAVRIARLESEVCGFTDGLKTRVGPRGVQLSGGQKQRVAIARAIVGRPEVLLLDDCTASLDAHTESELWDALREALPAATIILVTHRLHALETASQIVLLGDGGRLLDVGQHADLAGRSPEYQRLLQQWIREEDVVAGD